MTADRRGWRQIAIATVLASGPACDDRGGSLLTRAPRPPGSHAPMDAAIVPRETLDVPPVEISGVLEGDTVWEGRPYRIEGEVIVPEDATLTIRPGATLWFLEGARLTVFGQLRAEGTAAERIRMVADPAQAWVPDFHPSLPDGPPRWHGVRFEQSASRRNLLSHVDLEHAQHEEGAVGVLASEVVLDHLRISGTHLRM